MPKILRVNTYEVVLGMEDGSMLKYPRSACNYNPRVNDLVDIYESDFETVISKRERNSNYGDSRYVDRSTIAGGRYVDKTIYIILSFVLGCIGIQKFYSGRTMSGIFSLIFSWSGLPTLIGIYDGIKALGIPGDENGRIYI